MAAKGENHYRWKGGRNINSKGYIEIKCEGHPRANKGYVLEHILVAEKALGKQLPPGAEVHHANEIKTDNRPLNLVICPNTGYHNMLHKRINAKKKCGHADWLKCFYCGDYNAPEEMYVNPKGRGIHRKCRAKYEREHYEINKDRILAGQRKRYWEGKK